MAYTAYRDQLTIPVYSPFHRRAWMISPAQFRLVCKINGSRTITQRRLVDETGYSLHGVNAAIRSLSAGGLVAVLTRRGRKGWTRLTQKAGVHIMKAHELNVPKRGVPPKVLTESGISLGNISPATVGPPLLEHHERGPVPDLPRPLWIV